MTSFDWLTRFWIRTPGNGGRNEEVLQCIKSVDDKFAAQGVRVVVRFLKGRMGVRGHDIADVYSRALSGARTFAPRAQENWAEEFWAVVELYTMVRAMNEEEELNRKLWHDAQRIVRTQLLRIQKR